MVAAIVLCLACSLGFVPQTHAAESNSFILYDEFPNYGERAQQDSDRYQLNEAGITWNQLPVKGSTYQVVTAPPVAEPESSTGGDDGGTTGNGSGTEGGGGGRRGDGPTPTSNSSQSQQSSSVPSVHSSFSTSTSSKPTVSDETDEDEGIETTDTAQVETAEELSFPQGERIIGSVSLFQIVDEESGKNYSFDTYERSRVDYYTAALHDLTISILLPLNVLILFILCFILYKLILDKKRGAVFVPRGFVSGRASLLTAKKSTQTKKTKK